MTNGGDLFSKRTYRQGNVQQSLHPLNDQSNSQPLNVGKVLDDKVELSVARDYNSALGPNAFNLAPAMQNNSIFFADQATAETKTRPTFLLDTSAKAQKMSLLTQDYSENTTTKTTLEIMKQRRKKRESKQKFNVIKSNEIEGHYGEKNIEEILNFLEPERAKNEKMAQDKKKKKKSGGARKNKDAKSADAKELDVEVELDRDDAPSDIDDNKDKENFVEKESESAEMEGIELEETAIDDGVSDPVQSSIESPQNEQMETSDPAIESKSETPEQQTSKPQEPQLNKDDANTQLLNRSWIDFMKKYGASIYTYVDPAIAKTSGRNSTKRRSNGAQKENKPMIYRNSQKPRN